MLGGHVDGTLVVRNVHQPALPRPHLTIPRALIRAPTGGPRATVQGPGDGGRRGVQRHGEGEPLRSSECPSYVDLERLKGPFVRQELLAVDAHRAMVVAALDEKQRGAARSEWWDGHRSAQRPRAIDGPVCGKHRVGAVEEIRQQARALEVVGNVIRHACWHAINARRGRELPPRTRK